MTRWEEIRKMNWPNEYAENGIINETDFNQINEDWIVFHKMAIELSWQEIEVLKKQLLIARQVIINLLDDDRSSTRDEARHFLNQNP